MRKFIFAVTTALVAGLGAPVVTASTPAEDVKSFQAYFMDRFPGTELQRFGDGVYGIDNDARFQWEDTEEFPPYEDAVAEGEEMWNTAFKNGKTYADCLGSADIRANYPYFDTNKGEVITLEGEINRCRTENGEKPLKYKKGAMAKLTGYIASESQGKVFNVAIPNEAALAEYTRGKKHFYQKRGQLNLSCADCHQYNAGNMVRGDKLSPALGHLSHFPVYRKKWQSLGTPHRRFGGCNKQVRAKPFPAQSKEYKALEYFLTAMMNGMEANGPSSRK